MFAQARNLIWGEHIYLRARLTELRFHYLLAGQLAADIQITGIDSGKQYFVAVHSHSGLGVGNYAMTLDFGVTAAFAPAFASGALNAARPAQSFNLYVAKPQLFSMLLAAQAQAAGSLGAVRMTISDAAGATVATLTANAGDTVSQAALVVIV